MRLRALLGLSASALTLMAISTPAAAPLLATRLGANGVPAFDISAPETPRITKEMPPLLTAG